MDSSTQMNGDGAGKTYLKSFNSDVFIGSNKANIKTNSDSEYGFSSSVGPSVLDLMIDVKAFAKSITETLDYFYSAGAFE